MRAALVQMAPAALLCLPTAAVAKAQQAPTPETVTIVGCLVQGSPAGSGSERRSEAAEANADDFFLRRQLAPQRRTACTALGIANDSCRMSVIASSCRGI